MEISKKEQFIISANRNDVEKVKTFLSEGIDINCRSQFQGITALMAASQEDAIDVITILLANNADIKMVDDYNRNALDWAWRTNNWKAAYFLINAGIINESEYDENLEKAIWAENYEIVENLLRKGANANVKVGNESLLSLALDRLKFRNVNDSPIARLLIEYGANFDLNDFEKAVSLKEENLAILMINHSQFKECQFQNCHSIFEAAVRRGHINVINILCVNDPKLLNHRYYFNETPLMIAISNKFFSIVELLLSNGVQVNDEDNRGYTALDFAIEMQDKEIERLLLTYKAKLGSKIPTIEYTELKTQWGFKHICPACGRSIIEKKEHPRDDPEAKLTYYPTCKCGIEFYSGGFWTRNEVIVKYLSKAGYLVEKHDDYYTIT